MKFVELLRVGQFPFFVTKGIWEEQGLPFLFGMFFRSPIPINK